MAALCEKLTRESALFSHYTGISINNSNITIKPYSDLKILFKQYSIPQVKVLRATILIVHVLASSILASKDGSKDTTGNRVFRCSTRYCTRSSEMSKYCTEQSAI